RKGATSVGLPGRDRAAPRPPLAAPTALRVNVAVEVAVFARVGVEEAADCAVLCGDLRLDAAPGAAVARDDDTALHVYAAPFEFVVVARDAVVDVDELPRHVAVNRVGVVCGKLLRSLIGSRVLFERRFGEPRR